MSKARAMKKTLAQRVADLEKQVAELRRQRNEQPVEVKDWRQAVGMMEDTPCAREGDALGEAYRRSQTRP